MVRRPEWKWLIDVEDGSRELTERRLRKSAKSREEWMQKGSRFSEHHRKRE
jgi:hypothetical protein